MDPLRDISCQHVAYISIQVPAGSRRGLGRRETNRRPSDCRRLAEHGGDVHGDLLDVARMGRAGVGTAWRPASRDSSQRLQLLGQPLLGRSGRRRRGGVGCRRTSTLGTLHAHARRTYRGAGIAILANTRPYEGLLLSIPVAITLLFWWLKKAGDEFWLAARRVIVPLALCVVITGIAVGYSNWEGTGPPLELPYQVNNAAYEAAPAFIFQSAPKTPICRQDALSEFYLRLDLPQYLEARSAGGLLVLWRNRAVIVWLLLLGPLLMLPLVLAALQPRL
jgi:hypothetical protein